MEKKVYRRLDKNVSHIQVVIVKKIIEALPSSLSEKKHHRKRLHLSHNRFIAV